MNLRYVIALLSVIVTLACSVTMPITGGLVGTLQPATATQTYNAPETPQPTFPPSATDTAIPWLVITGNVYVRDDNGVVQGVLLLGDVVQAECIVQWCYIKSGKFAGYKIWRGCTSDPDKYGCESK